MEFNVDVTDTTTMVSQYRENPLCAQITVFWALEMFSKSMAYMDFYSQKWGMSDLEIQSEL